MATPEKKKLDITLKDILKDEFVTPQELIRVVNALIALFGGLNDDIDARLKSALQTASDLRDEDKRIDASVDVRLGKARDEILSVVRDLILKSDKEWQKEIARLEALIPEETDLSSIEERIGNIKSVTAEEIAQNFASYGAPIRDALELLQGDERLEPSAIKGLQELMDRLDKAASTGGVRLVGGTNGIQLYVNGVKKGTVKYLNFVPGTGITMTHVLSNGRNDITISASGGGGGFTKLTTASLINGINTALVFASKPTYIIADGAWYTENNGWTWNAATLTATMSIPPTSDAYGFV